MKKLFIVEKGSVAVTIAKVLAKKKGVAASQINNHTIKVADDYFVALAGHVLEQFDLKEYKGWEGFRWQQIDLLPYIPETFQKKVKATLKGGKKTTENNDARIKFIDKYSKEVDVIVHVGDADDEGQYLVDEVIEYIKCNKPIKRMWFSSLDDKAIEKAFDNLQDNNLFKKIGLAAQARSEADWIVGVNSTVLVSMIYRQSKASLLSSEKDVVSIGRVQTAVLNLIRERESLIENFVSQDVYSVLAHLRTKENETIVAELNTNLSPLKERLIDIGAVNDNGKIISKDEVDAMCRSFASCTTLLIDKVTTKEQIEHPDLPFSLSRLQQRCGKKYGMKAGEVLEGASNLYLKKLITYPRNNGCCHLSFESQKDVPSIIRMIKDLPISDEIISRDDLSLVDETYMGSKCWNDDEVNKKSHPAIIPTDVMTGEQYYSLSDVELKIYNEIVKFYLYQFMLPAKSSHINAKIPHPEDPSLVLTYNKKMYTERNWREAFNEHNDKSTLEPLPHLAEGEEISMVKMDAKSTKTEPLLPFTDASLIQAMEHVYRYIDTSNDPTGEKKQIKDRLKGKSALVNSDEVDVDKAIFTPEGGLGTDATRARILEILQERKFVEYRGKTIHSTELGRELLGDLNDNFKQPHVTGKWQLELDKIRNADDLEAAKEYKVQFSQTFAKDFKNEFDNLYHSLINNYQYKFPTPVIDLGEIGMCLSGSCEGSVHRYQNESSTYLRCNTCNAYHYEHDGKLIIKVDRVSEYKCLHCQKALRELKGVNKDGGYYHTYVCTDEKCKTYFSVGESGEPIKNKLGKLTDFRCRLCESQLRHRKGTKKADNMPYNYFVCDNDLCGKVYSVNNDEPNYPETTKHICLKCNRHHLVLVKREKEGQKLEFYACEDTVNCKKTYLKRENGEPNYPTEHHCNICNGSLIKFTSKDGKTYFQCENKDCGQYFNIKDDGQLDFPEALNQDCSICKKALYKFTGKNNQVFAGHLTKDNVCKLRFKLDKEGHVMPLESCQRCGQYSMQEFKGINKMGEPYHFFKCINQKCKHYDKLVKVNEHGKPDIYLSSTYENKVYTLLKGTCCSKCEGLIQRIENKEKNTVSFSCSECKTWFRENEDGRFIISDIKN